MTASTSVLGGIFDDVAFDASLDAAGATRPVEHVHCNARSYGLVLAEDAFTWADRRSLVDERQGPRPIEEACDWVLGGYAPIDPCSALGVTLTPDPTHPGSYATRFDGGHVSAFVSDGFAILAVGIEGGDCIGSGAHATLEDAECEVRERLSAMVLAAICAAVWS